ncbi:putative potassium channel, voltage-dependent, EAG [Rosa chinensis]|uniref:Putative potassium channel, voltage-dependent, EAG n=2 Tax=Rosa chinensis TaxID=74649 RepID=A0A2P6SM50_ROSCH|nr:putative potassium channel, voltage-dependent, EAG [Rosa chinensis]
MSSPSHSRSNNGNGDDSFEFSSPECYACTQAGHPVFHSTRCRDPIHHSQLQWERSAGSSLTRVETPTDLKCSPTDLTRTRVIDPRSNYVKRLNRVVLMARGLAVAVDPLFLYVIALSTSGASCFYMDVTLAFYVTVIRTCLDALHVAHILLQFKLAYVSSESMVIGCGKLVWDPREIAWHYMKSFRRFWLDVFVILPIPQIVIWLIEPKLLRGERPTQIMVTVLLTFLFQFTPKVYHIIHLAKRLKKVTGYIFSYGNIWWRFKLNVIAYLTACHIVGGIWYVLATQRVMSCIQEQCESIKKCNLSLYCSRAIFSHGNFPEVKKIPKIKAMCFDEDTEFGYGIYQPILLVYNGNTRAVRILYPIYWGLNNLGSFANNLTPTGDWLELIFSCCLCLAGLSLFITLLGNIQFFLHSIMSNKKKMQLKYRDMEWWMHRRQLPHHLRKRVRHFQRCSWAAMQGLDEIDLIQNFPDGLRRDIKRHLCLDLVLKVPLFHKLDGVILDNICDLVRPLIYSKGEKIIREGDPVQRMVFLVHGRIKRSQGLSKGFLATSVLEPGAFFGDELLSWCLRRPFLGRLPPSSATFTTMGPVEAFGLDAEFLRYISDQFRYKFSSENLRRTARYYSSNWRTWGAVIIQLAWRHHRERTKGSPTPIQNWDIENRLKMYAAMFLSVKPQDHMD